MDRDDRAVVTDRARKGELVELGEERDSVHCGTSHSESSLVDETLALSLAGEQTLIRNKVAEMTTLLADAESKTSRRLGQTSQKFLEASRNVRSLRNDLQDITRQMTYVLP